MTTSAPMCTPNRIALADCLPQPWRNGGGTTRELLALADDVVARVRDAWGVTLEREPVLLG